MVQNKQKMATAALQETAESQQKENHFSHTFHWEMWKSEWLSLAKLKACMEQSWNDSYLQQSLGVFLGGGVKHCTGVQPNTLNQCLVFQIIYIFTLLNIVH